MLDVSSLEISIEVNLLFHDHCQGQTYVFGAHDQAF